MATSKRIVDTPEIEAAIRKFEDYLWARCSLERTTIENYTGSLRRFLRVVGPNPTKEQVQSYYAERRRAGLSYAYAGYLSVGLERYMEMQGTPIELGRPPKPRRVLKYVLSEAEVTLLIAAAKTTRVRALLAVLAFGGTRNEETCRIKIEDVDISNNTIHIEGKGAKERKVCITGSCTELLVGYLQERKAAGAQPGDLLFVTERNGLPMEPQDIRKLVRVYAKRAGIKRRVHPHLLRHSLATNLMRRGASLIAIRDQLGHEFLQSTICYVHCTSEDLKSDYRRFSPSYL